MNDTGQQTEREVLSRIRPRYEAEGYRFVVQPGDDQLPEFLRGVQPDALAIKGDGGIVIEIQLSNRSARRSAVVDFFAGEVPKHAGWRFELVLAPNEMKELNSEPDIREIRDA